MLNQNSNKQYHDKDLNWKNHPQRTEFKGKEQAVDKLTDDIFNNPPKVPSIEEAVGRDLKITEDQSELKEPETTSSQPPDVAVDFTLDGLQVSPTTEDELVQQAMTDYLNELPDVRAAKMEDTMSASSNQLEVMQNTSTQQPPQISGVGIRESKNPPTPIPMPEPEKGQETAVSITNTPASNTENQPVTETCSPESVVVPPMRTKDKMVFTAQAEGEAGEPRNLRRIREYIHSEQMNVRSVYIHLASVTGNSEVVPRISLWAKPKEMEKLAELVYNTVKAPGFLENAYPSLCVVMANSIDNVVWSARVLTTIALFKVIEVLPYIED